MTAHKAVGLVVSGGRAYAADSGAGLQVFDLGGPGGPSALGQYNSLGDTLGLHVVGDRVYATDRDSGLQIISVGDPARPTLLGTYNTPGEARDVQVVGDRAYIVDGAAGLLIVDVSTPAAPVLLGGLNTPPSEPRLLSMGSPLWGGRRIVVSEGRAYLARLLGGLQILTARRQPATRMGGAAMHILLAEDAPDVAEVIAFSARLTWPKASVTTASSGAEALAAFAARPPDPPLSPRTRYTAQRTRTPCIVT